MNQFLKNLVATAILAGFTSVASATCVQGCNPPPPPAPLPNSSLSFEIGGTSMFGGLGQAAFEGKEGFAQVEKTGYAGTDTKLDAAGNLCGLNCQNGGFTFNGYAGEHVKAMSGAFSNQSGLGASAINQGLATSGVKFEFNKATVAPAQ